jgi:hypothetical protein
MQADSGSGEDGVQMMISIDEQLLALFLVLFFIAGYTLGYARRSLHDRATEIISDIKERHP